MGEDEQIKHLAQKPGAFLHGECLKLGYSHKILTKLPAHDSIGYSAEIIRRFISMYKVFLGIRNSSASLRIISVRVSASGLSAAEPDRY